MHFKYDNTILNKDLGATFCSRRHNHLRLVKLHLVIVALSIHQRAVWWQKYKMLGRKVLHLFRQSNLKKNTFPWLSVRLWLSAAVLRLPSHRSQAVSLEPINIHVSLSLENLNN